MRLKREHEEKSPPTWPAAIMQALAKYVFQSGMFSNFKPYLFLLTTLQFDESVAFGVNFSLHNNDDNKYSWLYPLTRM